MRTRTVLNIFSQGDRNWNELYVNVYFWSTRLAPVTAKSNNYFHIYHVSPFVLIPTLEINQNKQIFKYNIYYFRKFRTGRVDHRLLLSCFYYIRSYVSLVSYVLVCKWGFAKHNANIFLNRTQFITLFDLAYHFIWFKIQMRGVD